VASFWGHPLYSCLLIEIVTEIVKRRTAVERNCKSY